MLMMIATTTGIARDLRNTSLSPGDDRLMSSTFRGDEKIQLASR